MKENILEVMVHGATIIVQMLNFCNQCNSTDFSHGRNHRLISQLVQIGMALLKAKRSMAIYTG